MIFEEQLQKKKLFILTKIKLSDNKEQYLFTEQKRKLKNINKITNSFC